MHAVPLGHGVAGLLPDELLALGEARPCQLELELVARLVLLELAEQRKVISVGVVAVQDFPLVRS